MLDEYNGHLVIKGFEDFRYYINSDKNIIVVGLDQDGEGNWGVGLYDSRNHFWIDQFWGMSSFAAAYDVAVRRFGK